MAVTDKDGNALTRGALGETPVTDPDPLVTLTQDVYAERPPAVLNLKDFEGGAQPLVKVLVAKAGQAIHQSKLDRLYDVVTVDSFAPTSGAAAGGTVVTLTGTNLDRVASVTFDGAAGGSLTEVSPTELTVTTPAHAAGAVDVVVTDDDGDATTYTDAYTYV